MSDAAVTILVSGLITITTMVVGFLTLWIKLKYQSQKVEDKVDANTNLTRSGTAAASINAQVAAVAAKEAAEKTDELAKQMNGEMDRKIQKQIEPIVVALKEHTIQDDKNMKDIFHVLEEIKGSKTNRT